MQVMSINECKCTEISNQKFFNIWLSFFENKRRTGYDINIAKKKLFSGAILPDASNVQEAYLEPSQTSTSEHFCERG